MHENITHMNFEFEVLERNRVLNKFCYVWSQMSLKADSVTDEKLKAEIEKKVEILMETATYISYLGQSLHTEQKARQKAEYLAAVSQDKVDGLEKENINLKRNINGCI